MKEADRSKEYRDLRTGFWGVVRRELRHIRGYWRRYVMLVLILPLVSFALVWGLFYNQYPQELPVAVVDLDHSSLSRKLANMIDATSTMRVAWQPTDPAAAHELILSGKVYAAIIIPRQLERDLKRGLGGEVTGYYNAQMLMPGSIISSTLSSVVVTVSAGVNYDSRQRRGEMPEAAMAHLEPIRLERHVAFNPQLNYLYFLASALCPTFLQIFIIMTTVMTVGGELKDGTAREWLGRAGGSLWRAVMGKLLIYFLVFSALSMVMLAFIINAFGVPVHGSIIYMVAATILLVLAYQACGLIMVALNPSMRMALSASSFFSGAAFAFVGLTFPLGGMPALAKTWSNLLPLTHYLHVFLEQVIRGADVAASLYDMLMLCGFIALGLLLMPLLKRHLADKRYWGLP